MKKIIAYTLSLLAVITFTACNEDFKDWAEPQLNESETPVSITFQASNASYTMLDLNTITTDLINIATQSLDNAEGTTVRYVAQFSKDNTFAETTSVELQVSGTTLSALKADLQSAVTELYGKRPDARDLFMRINGYVSTGEGQTSLARSNNLELAIVPEAPVIESAYYFIGDATGWDITDLESYKFSHSDKDVYDDPTFTYIVNTAGASNFKIVPESSKVAGDWPGVLGCAVDGSTDLTGNLVVDGGAMKINDKGWVKITINMMDYTYSIEVIGEMALQLYVPGGYQGWSPSTAPIVYCKNFDLKYEGYVNIAGGDWAQGFKFVNGPDWPNADNGYKDYGVDGDGKLMGGDNVTVAEEGYYRLMVDLSGATYTYSATKTDWGLIGDATPGGWDTSTPLIYNDATGVWTVTATLVAGKEMKFRANDGWDINLGGNLSDLSYGGDNILMTDGGEYTITLDLSNPKVYKATLVKK